MVRVGICGTGSALKDFLGILPENVEVVALADNDPSRHGMQVESYPVYSVPDLTAMDLDFYVIASRAVDAIRAQLIDLGVSADRICAYYPSYSAELSKAVNRDIEKLNEALGTRIPIAGVATMYLWPEAEDQPRSDFSEDFVRRHSFRMCADRINNRQVPGAVAELGVYQGEQAALLNRLFPGRILHLFDTFEGFSDKDLSKERQANFSQAVLGDFQDTSVELVLGKMADPEMVKVHKGFFPETAKGLEEQFAFVSLDVDLYEPTLSGLEWFYPRLERGGAIFVHDYNNRRYLGVRNAVDEFIDKSGACALPLPDFAGSIVILK